MRNRPKFRTPQLKHRHLVWRLLCFAFCLGLIQAHATLSESNVLVIYNSQNNDSQAVHGYYKSVRTGVLSFDLNDSSITPGTISYADFASKIRDPLRTHLSSNGLSQTIHVLVLTKGLPHRIENLDTAAPLAGDNPFNPYYTNGNATFASVDAELTLLQFDLDSGEANGNYDSFADNAVNNPYFDANANITSFSRSGITSSNRSFFREGSFGWWSLYSTRTFGNITVQDQRLDAGHIYLTARLDAETVNDVTAMIDRAQAINFRSDVDALLFDSNGRTGTTPFAADAPFQLYVPLFSASVIDDYAEAQTTFTSTWDQFTWDDTGDFLIGNNPVLSNSNFSINRGPVAHLSSYGVNHGGGGNRRDYLLSYSGQLVNGASWIAYESYAAQGLGGVALSRQQGQVEEWIQAGGTFAMGNVWEPFTFGIPRSEIFLDRFLNQGFTYVEAAWASMLQLSWHIVVIGDPLATATVTTASEYDAWIFGQTGTTPDVDPSTAFTEDFESDGIPNGLEFALLGNAAQSDPNILPTQQLVTDSNEQYLELSYTRTDAENGLTYTVNTLEDLATSWPTDGSGVDTPVIIDNNDGTETWTYRRTAPVSDANAAFMRLDIGN